MKLRYLFLQIFYLAAKLSIGDYAVVVKPVVDGYGSPNMISSDPVESPLLGKCQRLHQLIFNEVVKVKDLTSTHAQVECGSFFFSGMHGQDQNSLWIKKENILSLKDLGKRSKSTIPFAPSYKKFTPPDNLSKKSKVLKEPFGKYSIGTRFVISREDENNYIVEAIDKHQAIKQIVINKKYFQPKVKNKRKAFVKIIQRLTQEKPKIRYIWGGTSFIKKSHHNKTRLPLVGMDCSGLILRTAQIVDIPYFCKNSLTASAYLEQITDPKKIEAGDIIWFPGHVIIILDPENNLCAEANGYYEHLHAIRLEKVFKDITSFKQMMEQKELQRIMPDRTLKKINQFKILKLPV